MPIRPENKARYPADWPLRRKFVLRRANHHCEWCGVRNYAVGYRDEDKRFIEHPLSRYYMPPTHKDAVTLRQRIERLEGRLNYIVIVLTTAHVHDDRPEASSLLNLAALCQRCHNVHDMAMRQENRRKNAQTDQLSLL